MSGIRLLYLGLVFAASTALGANEAARLVRKVVIPGAPTIVVVAEGDFEPRSIGSYSLRVYSGTNPRFPYDAFVAGTVRPRDGTVEDVIFSDLDRDGLPEIVVVIRSVGTGGELSAAAFRFHDTVLTILESVSGLAKDADTIRALEAKLAKHAEPRAVLGAGKPRQ